mmetsp:Transcript_12056/g.11929  ORF Transcript_12056/g.11929 Transcript_12056/m.11929 type:complete len:113 (-) Transcript_12056:578-916(-)
MQKDSVGSGSIEIKEFQNEPLFFTTTIQNILTNMEPDSWNNIPPCLKEAIKEFKMCFGMMEKKLETYITRANSKQLKMIRMVRAVDRVMKENNDNSIRNLEHVQNATFEKMN